MRVKEITPMDMLKDEIKQLKEEARVLKQKDVYYLKHLVMYNLYL